MSGERTKTLTRQMVVRVPESLYEELERDATANERTVAQSVRYHLRRALPAPSSDQTTEGDKP